MLSNRSSAYLGCQTDWYGLSEMYGAWCPNIVKKRVWSELVSEMGAWLRIISETAYRTFYWLGWTKWKVRRCRQMHKDEAWCQSGNNETIKDKQSVVHKVRAEPVLFLVAIFDLAGDYNRFKTKECKLILPSLAKIPISSSSSLRGSIKECTFDMRLESSCIQKRATPNQSRRSLGKCRPWR